MIEIIKIKLLHKIIVILLFFISIDMNGQQICNCDTIYDYANKMPFYDKDIKGLMNYLNEELVPILSDCMTHGDDLIASLYITLTIDKNGNVVDAYFRRPNLSNYCKQNLKKKLLTMKGWTAGQNNKNNVCARFNWPISCINWQ